MIYFSELTREDVDEVCKIEEAVFSMPWKARDFIEMIEADYAYYVVAKEDGIPIGCCGVRNMCGDGEITNVVIREDKRRLGAGYRMLQFMMNEARTRGVNNFTLEVRASNAPAIALYERLGFVSEGVRPSFYEKPREDAIIMWKRNE